MCGLFALIWAVLVHLQRVWCLIGYRLSTYNGYWFAQRLAACDFCPFFVVLRTGNGSGCLCNCLNLCGIHFIKFKSTPTQIQTPVKEFGSYVGPYYTNLISFYSSFEPGKSIISYDASFSCKHKTGGSRAGMDVPGYVFKMWLISSPIKPCWIVSTNSQYKRIRIYIFILFLFDFL